MLYSPLTNASYQFSVCFSVDPALLHEAVPPSSEAAIAYVQRAIASSINLICQPTAMEVSVQKAVLQVCTR